VPVPPDAREECRTVGTRPTIRPSALATLSPMKVVRNALTGAVAGAVATAAMDLVSYRRYRSGGGEERLSAWEFSSSARGFGEDAPAPARVGKRIADSVGVDLPDTSAAAANNVVHWMTGVGWGELGGLAAAILPVPALVTGIGTGVTAWATSYAVLGRLGIYKPIGEYDRETLWKDLSVHLVYGATLGAVLTMAGVRRRG
jgi:hypothetical protein